MTQRWMLDKILSAQAKAAVFVAVTGIVSVGIAGPWGLVTVPIWFVIAMALFVKDSDVLV